MPVTGNNDGDDDNRHRLNHVNLYFHFCSGSVGLYLTLLSLAAFVLGAPKIAGYYDPSVYQTPYFYSDYAPVVYQEAYYTTASPAYYQPQKQAEVYYEAESYYPTEKYYQNEAYYPTEAYYQAESYSTAAPVYYQPESYYTTPAPVSYQPESYYEKEDYERYCAFSQCYHSNLNNCSWLSK